MDFYDLPDEVLVDICKALPLAWFRICEIVPFIGEWTSCQSTQRLIKKPFVQVIQFSFHNESAGMHGNVSDSNYHIWWHLNGRVHRDGDLPAIVKSDGGKCWYRLGKKHRDGDFPANICANGDKEWWTCGVIHRNGDPPAIERSNGDKHWYNNGRRHRDGDLPAIEYANGDKEWWNLGQFSSWFKEKF